MLAKISVASFGLTLAVALSLSGAERLPGLAVAGAPSPRADGVAQDLSARPATAGPPAPWPDLPAADLPGTPTTTPTAHRAGPYGVHSVSALTGTGIPVRALRAYVRAAAAVAATDPDCRLDWTVLAAIGRVESDHGRFGGSVVGDDGVVRPAILGVRLDGTRAGTAVIHDSDGGRLDGDPGFDRAVGPMQFLPGTWAGSGADGDGDGVRNPQDIDDAALAAAHYLCSGPATFVTETGAWAAVFRYNRSDSYVSLVQSLAAFYRSGQEAPFAVPPPGVPRPHRGGATPPGPPPALPAPGPGPAVAPPPTGTPAAGPATGAPSVPATPPGSGSPATPGPTVPVPSAPATPGPSATPALPPGGTTGAPPPPVPSPVPSVTPTDGPPLPSAPPSCPAPPVTPDPAEPTGTPAVTPMPEPTPTETAPEPTTPGATPEASPDPEQTPAPSQTPSADPAPGC